MAEVKKASQPLGIETGIAFIEGESAPLIPPGEYDLTFQYYETAKLWGGKSQKLVLWFEIASYGSHHGKRVARYYNVKRVKGVPRKSGDFAISRNCDFVREYASLFGIPNRIDRLPMTRFKGCLIRGTVRTVRRGYTQRAIPKDLHYSVVGELLAVKRL